MDTKYQKLCLPFPQHNELLSMDISSKANERMLELPFLRLKAAYLRLFKDIKDKNSTGKNGGFLLPNDGRVTLICYTAD